MNKKILCRVLDPVELGFEATPKDCMRVVFHNSERFEGRSMISIEIERLKTIGADRIGADFILTVVDDGPVRTITLSPTS